MFRLILHRLLLAIPLALGASFLTFSILDLVPGDPVVVMLGDRALDRALVEKFRRELHLDDPFLLRYGRFVGNLGVGNFGRSYRTNRSIGEDLKSVLPASAELAVAALAVSLVLGFGAGLAAALRPGSKLDGLLMAGALAGVSVPIFWLALTVSWLFSTRWHLFSLTGRLGGDYSDYVPRTGFAVLDALWYRDPQLLGSAVGHLAMPAMTLGLAGSALIARMTRSSILEAKNRDYVRTARAKGLPSGRVLVHILRNALLPVVTVVGLQFGSLLGGAIITEEIFAWPGVGTYLVQAIRYRDLVAVQGGVMAVVLLFLFVNLCVDILYAVIDPRTRQP